LRHLQLLSLPYLPSSCSYPKVTCPPLTPFLPSPALLLLLPFLALSSFLLTPPPALPTTLHLILSEPYLLCSGYFRNLTCPPHITFLALPASFCSYSSLTQPPSSVYFPGPTCPPPIPFLALPDSFCSYPSLTQPPSSYYLPRKFLALSASFCSYPSLTQPPSSV